MKNKKVIKGLKALGLCGLATLAGFGLVGCGNEDNNLDLILKQQESIIDSLSSLKDDIDSLSSLKDDIGEIQLELDNQNNIAEYIYNKFLGSPGLKYYIDEETKEVYVLGFGDTKEIVIPEYRIVNNELYPVTNISVGSFCYVTELYIPKTIKYIVNYNHWEGVNYLERIIVDENNENYKSIDGVLYSKDGTELIRYPAKKLMSLILFRIQSKRLAKKHFMVVII